MEEPPEPPVEEPPEPPVPPDPPPVVVLPPEPPVPVVVVVEPPVPDGPAPPAPVEVGAPPVVLGVVGLGMSSAAEQPKIVLASAKSEHPAMAIEGRRIFVFRMFAVLFRS